MPRIRRHAAARCTATCGNATYTNATEPLPGLWTHQTLPDRRAFSSRCPKASMQDSAATRHIPATLTLMMYKVGFWINHSSFCARTGTVSRPSSSYCSSCCA